mgnify:CR=1 FL=1
MVKRYGNTVLSMRFIRFAASARFGAGIIAAIIYAGYVALYLTGCALNLMLWLRQKQLQQLLLLNIPHIIKMLPIANNGAYCGIANGDRRIEYGNRVEG